MQDMHTPWILSFDAACDKMLVEKNIISVYIMNTWKDLWGSDAWVSTLQMPWQHYDVWHCSERKNNIWGPNAAWEYLGHKDWWNYGSKGNTPNDYAVEAIKKYVPMANAARKKAKAIKARIATQNKAAQEKASKL